MIAEIRFANKEIQKLVLGLDCVVNEFESRNSLDRLNDLIDMDAIKFTKYDSFLIYSALCDLKALDQLNIDYVVFNCFYGDYCSLSTENGYISIGMENPEIIKATGNMITEKEHIEEKLKYKKLKYSNKRYNREFIKELENMFYTMNASIMIHYYHN